MIKSWMSLHQLSHSGRFIKFFVSPTGDFAVIAGTDQILRIFDLSTGLVVSKGVGQSDTFGQRIACRFTVRRFASLTSPKMHLGVITEASRLQLALSGD
ncbi:hypothetical protein SeMB42_g02099 [Synchytrium endobioticum]|uniref:Uncharacterized protein n=1 Tax=Synchytrium endobioticum TaxID=286115 RepID=A0A507DGS0_9FUNG|nr:hypothetical protein SeMB42_g02099 [Synchytrium endobioticum]